MQYLLLIYRDPSVQPPRGGAHDDVLDAYRAYTRSLQDAGVFVAGDALQAADTASTVRTREAGVLRTDGPFAESKEQLAGYYLVDCADRAEAEAWAARCPGALDGGAIEVRPIWRY